MGQVTLKKLQYGAEETRGTAVAATRMLLGEVNVPVDRKPSYPSENLGVRADSFRSEIYQILADGIKLNIEHGYFQALPVLFGIAIKGGVTGAEETADQDDYLWDFTPSMTADNEPDSITLEMGDDTQAYEVEYVMCRRIKLSGRLGSDEPVKIEADLFGEQLTPTTFTGAISLPGVEAMIANKTQIYIDTTWAGLGSTQKSSLLREWSWELITGVHPKFHGDSQMMTGYGEGVFAVIITLTLEGDSGGDGEFDAFQAQTERAIRIEVPGSQLGTGENHRVRLDAWGTYEEVVPMGSDADGDNLHTAVFHGYYDDTGAALFDVDVITDLAAV